MSEKHLLQEPLTLEGVEKSIFLETRRDEHLAGFPKEAVLHALHGYKLL